MQATSIILLYILYAISIEGFIDLFSPVFVGGYVPLHLSLLLSGIGIGLGMLFCGITQLNKNIRQYIIVGIPGFIFFIIVFTYFIFGVYVFFDLIINLIKIGLGLMLCSIPLIGTYGLFKGQHNIILAAGTGLLFFFFFVRILPIEFVSFVEEIQLLILFFILFACYL